jgi:hypothetical protein
MICFPAQRQGGLACRLRGLAVASVVLDAGDQQRDPACQGQDLAVLLQGESLALEGTTEPWVGLAVPIWT